MPMYIAHINAHQLGIYILYAVDEPTGSKDNDYDYWLPFLDASVKRKASETDGENVYTEKYAPFELSPSILLLFHRT